MALAFALMIEGQEGLTWERWQRLARAAEDLGYESLFRSDHLTGLFGDSTRPSLDQDDLAALELIARDVLPAFR